MPSGQLERSLRRVYVALGERAKDLLCDQGTGLELAEAEYISPASDEMQKKWNRQSDYLRSERSSGRCD